uniref:Uncharacterized protein n=1 Tax=Nelumbo nucifera TaxID=4432 RepID=A0A822ZVY3_NELNU|nr:TPA_asm: hypothetical protein HUJ06_017422 [Nelumbo nucifera]
MWVPCNTRVSEKLNIYYKWLEQNCKTSSWTRNLTTFD